MVKSSRRVARQRLVEAHGLGQRHRYESEALKYIFDEFRQADMSSTRSTAAPAWAGDREKFINLMGGEIVVESEEGKGSKFTITLPMELKISSVRGEGVKRKANNARPLAGVYPEPIRRCSG